MPKELDLSQPEEVLKYLAETPFASSGVERLSGGRANFVFRLYLKIPYNGWRTLVMKHGKGWYPNDESFPFSVERQNYEVRALRSLNAFFSANALARAPLLIHFDPIAHILFLEDCGENAHNLGQLLKEGLVDLQACRIIGKGLGTFLTTVHGQVSKDRALMEYLEKNTAMKQYCALMVYGRLVDTLTGERKARTGETLVHPPVAESISEEAMHVAREIAQETAQAILGADANATFTHGDFSAGNIVVRTSKNTMGALQVERIFVIDWEMTKPGSPWIEVGQFIAELHTIHQFHGASSKLAEETLRAFLAAYGDGYPVDERFLRGAISHLGAHLISYTPIRDWEPKEKVREVVQEGVGYLVRSKKENLETLEKLTIIPLE